MKMDATIALISGDTIRIKDVLIMTTQGSFLVITDSKEGDSYIRLEEIRYALCGDFKVMRFVPVDKGEAFVHM
jgi:hypothetical protein